MSWAGPGKPRIHSWRQVRRHKTLHNAWLRFHSRPRVSLCGEFPLARRTGPAPERLVEIVASLLTCPGFRQRCMSACQTPVPASSPTVVESPDIIQGLRLRVGAPAARCRFGALDRFQPADLEPPAGGAAAHLAATWPRSAGARCRALSARRSPPPGQQGLMPLRVHQHRRAEPRVGGRRASPGRAPAAPVVEAAAAQPGREAASRPSR